jgi:ABC-type transport system substrate-binding protein
MNIFNKLKIIFAMTLVVSGMVAAPTFGVELSQDDNTIVYALPYDFSEYSQFTADSYATVQWTSAVYAGLFQRDTLNNRDYSPDLAAAQPTISTDGKTWTVDLKSGLKFATGGALTADDVVFSYKVALTPGINTASYGTLAQYFASNDSVTKIDADTVQFELSTTYAFGKGLLTQGIVEQAEFEDDYLACLDGDDLACTWNRASGEDARGAGPYFVDEIDTTNMVVTLKKNANYWDADNVMADTIIYKKVTEGTAAISELGAGTIDIMDSQYVPAVDAFDGLSNVFETFVGDPAHQEVSLNHLNPFFGTGTGFDDGDTTDDARDALNVRKAMSHIVNRQNFVDEILEGLGQAASTHMPSASLGWDSELAPRSYSIATARDYMEAAGFDFSVTSIDKADAADKCDVDTADDCFFTVTVLSPNTNPARNQWSAAFVAELPKIGIGVVEHVSTGWDEIIPRTFGADDRPGAYADGGFDIFFVGYSWDLDYDPSGLLTESGLCGTGSCDNFYNYVNATVESLIIEYTSELNFDARITKVKTLQKAMFDDIPVIPILYPQSHWGWSTDVSGIDELLISVSAQDWGDVTKDGWTANEGSSLDSARSNLLTPPVESTESTGSSFLPFNSTFMVLGMSFALAIVIVRRRKD